MVDRNISDGEDKLTAAIEEMTGGFVCDMLHGRGIRAKFSLDTSLINSGLIDSMSIVTFVAKLENAFGITIAMSDMTLDNFDTIQLIRDFVKSKLSVG